MLWLLHLASRVSLGGLAVGGGSAKDEAEIARLRGKIAQLGNELTALKASASAQNTAKLLELEAVQTRRTSAEAALGEMQAQVATLLKQASAGGAAAVAEGLAAPRKARLAAEIAALQTRVAAELAIAHGRSGQAAAGTALVATTTTSAPVGGCNFEPDTDFSGAPGDVIGGSADKESCCASCHAAAQVNRRACVAAVHWDGVCYLQRGGAVRLMKPGRWACVPVFGVATLPAAAAAVATTLAPPPAAAVTGAVAGGAGSVAGSVAGSGTTAILVICYNRPDYLQRMLTRMLEQHPVSQGSAKAGAPEIGWAIVVSQDGTDAAVADVIHKFAAHVAAKHPLLPVVHIQHQQHQGGNGYEKLASHFGWAFGQIFGGALSTSAGAPLKFARVITLEDDLLVAADFFSYFHAVAPLLDQDPTLLAASAYNDNGQRQFVLDPEAVYRTNCFPGLGWMMNAAAWAELGPKWPGGYWDDWLREPPQTKGRAFLRPEVGRTKTYGRVGVSQAQFFDQYLDTIQLNDKPVDFSAKDMSYLTQAKYDVPFDIAVAAARVVTLAELKAGGGAVGSVRLQYSALRNTADSYMTLATQVGLMADIKADVPRTAYHGVVTFRYNGRLVYLAPATFNKT